MTVDRPADLRINGLPKSWNEPHALALTFIRPPNEYEEIVLRLQGKVVPPDQYEIVENGTKIIKKDATWGDCCTAQVQIRVIPRSVRFQSA